MPALGLKTKSLDALRLVTRTSCGVPSPIFCVRRASARATAAISDESQKVRGSPKQPRSPLRQSSNLKNLESAEHFGVRVFSSQQIRAIRGFDRLAPVLYILRTQLRAPPHQLWRAKAGVRGGYKDGSHGGVTMQAVLLSKRARMHPPWRTENVTEKESV